jgi:predicted metal-dependent hydrolase
MKTSKIDIDEIIRTQRKTIAIIVDMNGRVIVRAPLNAPSKQIEAFINEKEEWIRSKKVMADELPKIQPKEYVTGEEFYYLGRTYPLEIVGEQSKPLILSEKFLLSNSVRSKAEEVFTKWYKVQARRVITERVEKFAKGNGFVYERIRITRARTRWGSCSSKGSLNFTWRLVMAPLFAIDYVVIHELVHLAEKNHSKVYWNIVKNLMPDYRERKSWLNENGQSLTL